MPEPTTDYSAIPDMVRELRALDPASAQHRRLYEEIVTRAMPLAEHAARRFRGRGQSHDDLRQVASVGLVNAVNRFDPDKGFDFLSFAVPTIMGEVRRYFRDSGWALKVPRGLKDISLQLPKAREALSAELGRAPTASEVAAHLGVHREHVVQASIASSHYSTVSTDKTHASDSEYFTLKETLGEMDTRLDMVVDVETIRPLIEKLPVRQQTLLKLRFFDEMTQTQIADRLGCSQMHVSRMLTKALATLRDQAGVPPHTSDSAVVRRGKSTAA